MVITFTLPFVSLYHKTDFSIIFSFNYPTSLPASGFQSYFLKQLSRCTLELYGKKTQCLFKVSQTKGFRLFAKSDFCASKK